MLRLLSILFFLSIIDLAHSQDLLTPELLWEIDRISQDDISEDGSKVLYGVSDYNLKENKGNRNLYYQSTNGGSPKQLTDFPGSEYNAQFKPNSQKIGFLYGGNLWEMNLDGSHQQIVSNKKITSFKYFKDGSGLVFTQDVVYADVFPSGFDDLPLATARIYDDLLYRHWDHWEDNKKSNLFYSLFEGDSIGSSTNIINEPYDVPLMPFGGKEEYSISPDGNWIAYTSKKLKGKEYAVSTNSDIYLFSLKTGETKNITRGMMGYDKGPLFSPDSKKIIWNSMRRDGYESDRNRIFILDIDSGQKIELTEGYDNNANGPQFSKDGKTIYFLSGLEATIQIMKISSNGGEIEKVTDGRHNIYDFQVASNNLIVRKCTMTKPHELYNVNTENGRMERLSFVTQKVMAKVKDANVKERWIETHDGKKMLVWYIYPPDFDPNKKYPALLYCQGGPQSAVNQFFSFRWNFSLMAANDYIIIAPNRRGLPSFGQEWNEAISKDWGGNAMKDYLTAIDDAIEYEQAIDSERVGAVGASYGGYSVYWLAGNHENRFKSLISHCGLFNLESWYGTTEELFFANFDIGGAYWDKDPVKSYELDSPHKYVQNWNTPILVIHGEKDFRVPISEGLQAFQTAQLQEVKSRFLYFPDEGHWVLNPQNGVFWHRIFFDWLDQHLK